MQGEQIQAFNKDSVKLRKGHSLESTERSQHVELRPRTEKRVIRTGFESY